MSVLRLSVLGATGSIGTQALDVVRFHRARVEVVAATAESSARQLEDIAREMGTKLCGLTRPPEGYRPPDDMSCEWRFGEDALIAAATLPEADAVLCAVVGAAGLRATLAALKAGKRVLLANKESLVAGGELVMKAAGERGASLFPVDSEHSAIFQCLHGNPPPERIVLTASGGPFRTWEKSRIENATARDALCHPTWRMGPKITVDSASLMNKGLELIEAGWLFGLPETRIDVAVHPQSVVHSAVEFADGAVIAQMGVPDMRVPIQLALTWPERLPSPASRLDFAATSALTFEAPDLDRFPCLALARDAMRAGGTAPAILNAANEAAVSLFLGERICFGMIPRLVADALAAVDAHPARSFEAIIEDDRRAREFVARALIG